MIRVVIIHGTEGSPDSNWFPWLANELRMWGIEVLTPQMPTPAGQSLQSWMDAFKEQVGTVGPATILIGHSLGATFILRILELIDKPVFASIFVAGFTGTLGIPKYDQLNRSFIDKPFNWEQISRSMGRPFCFLGEDDPYVPLSLGRKLANQLKVDPIVLKAAGHINAESGFSSFPLLLSELKKLNIRRIEVRNSPISGKGVFATSAIKAGEKVLLWQPLKHFPAEELSNLPNDEKHYIQEVDNGKYILMNAPERFVNHSCSPNTKAVDQTDIAIRDIAPGEEITSDYGHSALAPFNCSCGSKNCRGKIPCAERK